MENSNTNSNTLSLLTDSSAFELGKNYLRVNESASDEELRQAFATLSNAHGSSLFWIGDLLAHVEAKKGAMYSRAMEETSYAKGTLKNAKSLAQRFPRELRTGLSYSHHFEALSNCKGNIQLALKYLGEAERLNYDVRTMRRAIRVDLQEEAPKKETVVLDTEFIYLLDSFDRIRAFLQNVTSTEFAQKKAFVLGELEELMELARKVCK